VGEGNSQRRHAALQFHAVLTIFPYFRYYLADFLNWQIGNGGQGSTKLIWMDMHCQRNEHALIFKGGSRSRLPMGDISANVFKKCAVTDKDEDIFNLPLIIHSMGISRH
jgi:hypothetical protein